MGIEYQADFAGSLPPSTASELFALLCSHADYVVVWVEDNRIIL